MDHLKSLIKEAAFLMKERVRANRRHLHKYPELSFQEWNTAAFIKAQLNELGIPWEPVADTGIIAHVKGQSSSDKIIALRADIDALPIQEENTADYRSCNDGVMHACGHDVHTASLLGVASILNRIKHEFAGTVKLIFQPGEEMLPGGASKIIEEGGLKDPDAQVILGQHVMPAVPAGKIAVRKGLFMASMDEIKIAVYGKGGHGAEPHKCIDPVMITCTLLQALQQLVSRNADPLMPSVLSFGKLKAEGAINIIPDRVLVEGTFRTLDEGWRYEAHKKIEQLATTLVAGMGGRCTLKIGKGYPHLKNDEAFGNAITGYLGEYAGRENIVSQEVWMAAEDFAYYTQALPGFFYLLGVGNEAKKITSSLHTATFNIDEDVLELSCGLMSYAALRWLGNG